MSIWYIILFNFFINSYHVYLFKKCGLIFFFHLNAIYIVKKSFFSFNVYEKNYILITKY